MDPPGDEHLHTNDQGLTADTAYTEYYFQRATEMFGENEKIDLAQPVINLLKADPYFDVQTRLKD